MIPVPFRPPEGDAAWDDWMVAARDATTELSNQADGDRKVDDRIYKAQRDRFFRASHGKCVYCESKLAAQTGYGDVEHYRPKGRARGLDGKVAQIDRHGQRVNHPGYYWLAYDYRNLCPSCPRCNRRTSGVGGEGTSGKSDLFPTLDNRWSSGPDDPLEEHPALLKPWMGEDDPSVHLRFDPDTGLVFGTTERGRITVELLGLNREGLVQLRLDSADRVKDLVAVAAGRVVDHGLVPRAERLLDAIRDGEAQYAAICRVALAAALPGLRGLLDAIEAAAGAAPPSPD